MGGLVGIVSKKDCKKDLFYATDYHSHLGTVFGGMAIFDGTFKRKIHTIDKFQFKSRFVEDIDFTNMEGNKGLGVISDRDAQPLVIKLKFGEFAICGSGYINNQKELVEKLLQEGVVFSEMINDQINQIEIVGNLINKGEDIKSGIEYMFSQIKGSMSLLLLCKDGIYAVRDKFGRTPLVLAEKQDSKIVVSETCSFKNLGFKTKKFLGPGEIILITENDIVQIKEPEKKLQLCTFLFVYTGFPASEYEGKSVQAFREKLGRSMASKDYVRPDFVSGIADSGTAYSYGYASESRIPISLPLLKYTPGWARSYVPPDQTTRDKIALMKQIVAEEILKEKKIVITEDSIVRGTQLKNFLIAKLLDAGANEIHLRPACPPLMFPCPFLVATRSLDELFARKILKKLEQQGKRIEIGNYLDPDSQEYKEMIKVMEQDLGVTSLVYPKIEEVIEAIGLPKENLCTYCWTGKDDSGMA
ncbi:MAG: amidophosphoribosyltransferase [Candidatus Pacearchaeota archaeon]